MSHTLDNAATSREMHLAFVMLKHNLRDLEQTVKHTLDNAATSREMHLVFVMLKHNLRDIERTVTILSKRRKKAVVAIIRRRPEVG